MNFKRFLFSMALLMGMFHSLSAFAQQTIKLDGVKYYVHFVEPGHTLYSISKTYSVNIEDIINANPGSEKGLRIDQQLYIPIKKVNKKKAKDNPPAMEGEYLVHTIQPKETIYGLTKKYQITQEELYQLNPHAKDGLKIGMQIRIVADKTSVSSPVAVKPAVEDSLITHMVKEGETRFTLAKKYNVNIDSIQLLNPNLPREINEGDLVRIPKLKNKFVTVVDTSSVQDTSQFKEIYQVAFMLPFYLDENDTVEVNRQLNEGPSIYPRSELALRFYEGAKLAIDSMRDLGMSLSVYVFDTKRDTSTVKSFLGIEEMEKMDMIFGPLYQSNFKIISAYAKPRGIKMVSPVPQSNRILLDNEHVSKTSASVSAQVSGLASFMAQEYTSNRIIAINSGELRDRRLMNIFRNEYANSMVDSVGENSDSPLQETYFYNVTIDTLKKVLLPDSQLNVIVVPSTNQDYITNLLTKLNLLMVKGGWNIRVFGLDAWKRFDNVDVDYLHISNVHIASTGFINNEDSATWNFLNKFRANYHTYPGKFGVAGFDISMYYLNMLYQYGTGFQSSLDKVKAEGLGQSFSFFKTGIESGYENRSVRILKYQDYKLIQVD